MRVPTAPSRPLEPRRLADTPTTRASVRSAPLEPARDGAPTDRRLYELAREVAAEPGRRPCGIAVGGASDGNFAAALGLPVPRLRRGRRRAPTRGTSTRPSTACSTAPHWPTALLPLPRGLLTCESSPTREFTGRGGPIVSSFDGRPRGRYGGRAERRARIEPGEGAVMAEAYVQVTTTTDSRKEAAEIAKSAVSSASRRAPSSSGRSPAPTGGRGRSSRPRSGWCCSRPPPTGSRISPPRSPSALLRHARDHRPPSSPGSADYLVLGREQTTETGRHSVVLYVHPG